MVKSLALDRFLHTGVPLSVEHSTRIFHSLHRLLSLGGGLLPRTLCLVNSSCLGLPILSTLCQLRESTVPHLDSPSLCMTGNSLKTLSWSNHRVHLMPFPSLKITILHCLMSGILKNHCFIYSNRRVNLIPVIPSQQEAEVPVCQVFTNYIHIANSKYQVSVLIFLDITFWQADCPSLSAWRFQGICLFGFIYFSGHSFSVAFAGLPHTDS